MYTNNGNIELPLAVWLAANDGYDRKFDPNVYSVSELLKSTKSTVLTRMIKAQKKEGSVDIADLVPSRLGHAVHTAAEVSWLYNRHVALKNLGYNDTLIRSIRLNPEDPGATADNPLPINVYIEQRSNLEVLDGMSLSGKFDFVIDGVVKDIKTTKVYNWIHGGNDEKYALQGSCYRWLNQDIITEDYMTVEFMFTDWSPLKAQIQAPDYPPQRVMTRKLRLKSIDETEDFIRGKFEEFARHQSLDQSDMAACTPDELWMKPSKFAYYKIARNTSRATKLYDTYGEASARNTKDGGVGRIIERKGEPTFCKFCEAMPHCAQAAQYIMQGILEI